MKYILFIFVNLFLITSCAEKSVIEFQSIDMKLIPDTSAMGRHYAGSPMDSLMNFDLYHYEYRTERWNGYRFNYDIYGHDENGKFVYGNVNIIDTSNGYGTGYIYVDNGKDLGDDLFVIVYQKEGKYYTGTDENDLKYDLEVFNCFYLSSDHKFKGSAFDTDPELERKNIERMLNRKRNTQ